MNDAFYKAPDRGEGSRTIDEEEENPQTALLPKSVCGDASYKEGDTITLRIVKDHGDEYEVEHSEPEEERGRGAGRSQQPPIPADDELAAMDSGE